MVKAGHRACFQTQHIWRCIYLFDHKGLTTSRSLEKEQSTQYANVTAVQFSTTSGDVLWHLWIVQEKLHKQRKRNKKKQCTRTLSLLFLFHITFSPLSQTMAEQMLLYGCSQYFLQVLRNSLRTSLKSNRPEQPLEVTEFSMQSRNTKWHRLELSLEKCKGVFYTSLIVWLWLIRNLS